MKSIALSIMLALAFSANARAQAPQPRVKPDAPHYSAILDRGDFALLSDGLRAAGKDDWPTVRALERRADDPLARDVLRWVRLTGDKEAPFAELSQGLQDFAEWPRRTAIRANAEAAIGRSRLQPAVIDQWFVANPATTGPGLLAHADALFALGQGAEATKQLKSAWREHLLSRKIQDEALSRHQHRLSRADHAARVDFLLWHGHRSNANALAARLSRQDRALAVARIRLAARSRGVDSAIAAVPRALQKDPGLLYERARWRRRARRTEDARSLILEIPADLPKHAAERVWGERRIHISRALKAREFLIAYKIAAAHGLTVGEKFADGEWLAGWLALRRLNDLPAAEQHFTRLKAGVSTPISLARANYWLARTAEARGDLPLANTRYREAATYATTYYGQLAVARLGDAARAVRLPTDASPTPEQIAEFMSRPPVRALRLFAELDEPRRFDAFAFALDDRFDEPWEYALLAEIAFSYGREKVGVRGGKTGLARGVLEPSAAYPVIDVSAIPRHAPEPAFVLALARQESEFYARAVSHAGARGLMQLLPRTARATARSRGRPYRYNWLTDDPDYNLEIGSTHLGDLVREFDGSYIMAAAGYNAGGSRVRRWIREYGDPRSPDVDAVDWVESIPFSETRNYVQRVMENLNVYRGRLNGGQMDIQTDRDLKRGGEGRS